MEYRLLDSTGQYPTLYYYQDIDEAEISARFACDYFVKDGKLYEKQSCSLEPLGYVVYVTRSDEEITAFTENARQDKKHTRIEVRQFCEDTESYPLIFTYEIHEKKEVALYLLSDYFIWSGREWRKTSAEIDEDRQVYVIYAMPCMAEENNEK